MPSSRSHTALLLLLTALPCCRTAAPSTPPAPPASTTEPAVSVALSTVVLVRHGEKASDDPRDPSLSAAGDAVVAAHSNTLPTMIAALGGQVQDTVEADGQRMLPDAAYDRLFVVTRPAPPATGEVRTLELRYGAATP